MKGDQVSTVMALLLAAVVVVAAACDDKNGDDGPSDTSDATDVPADETGDTTEMDGTDAPDVTVDGADTVEPDAEQDVEDEEVPCVCGNGETQTDCGEECDDGNYDNADDCLTSCVAASCGDGFLRLGPGDPADEEECDDGNDVAGDGCENDCTYTCHDDGECDDSNPCTIDVCNVSTHVCSSTPGYAGEECGGDICSGLGTCLGGTCVYADPLECDDGESCTTDSCDPTDGCVNEPLPVGDSCDDGFFCWTGDECRAGGYCSGDPVSPCDDGDPCTIDSCNEIDDVCEYQTPSYSSLVCGSDWRANTFGMSSDYDSVTCPDGAHTVTGPDEILELGVTASGALVVTVDTDMSLPGTQVFILTDACDPTSCIGHGADTVTVSVSTGSHYVLVESPAAGGTYALNPTCP